MRHRPPSEIMHRQARVLITASLHRILEICNSNTFVLPIRRGGLRMRSNYIRAALRNRTPEFLKGPMQSTPRAHDLASRGRRRSPNVQWRPFSFERTCSGAIESDFPRVGSASCSCAPTRMCSIPDMALDESQTSALSDAKQTSGSRRAVTGATGVPARRLI